MTDLLGFKDAALARGGVCAEYARRWDAARTKAELMDIALDPNGAYFVCEGIAGGWGLDPDFIARFFRDYVNGGYVRRKGGYTSEMYVGVKWDVTVRTTLVVAVGCACAFIVPANRICRLFVVGGGCVEVVCEGMCELYVFGDVRILEGGNGRISRKNH